jgi:arylsulfatase A-like enzyme
MLIAYYPLDELSGTRVTNVVNGAAAYATNLSFAQPGVVGTSVRFTEASFSAINLGASSSVCRTGAFSVVFWAMASTNGFDENERLLDVSNADALSGVTKGFNFKKQNNAARLFVADGVTNRGTTGTASLVGLTNSLWYLLAIRYTPSSIPGVTADGTMAATALALGINPVTAASVNSRTECINNHVLGSLAYDRALLAGVPSGAAVTASLAFDGWMDDLRFYDGALTDDELAALYNQAAFATNPPPVVNAGARRWQWNVVGDFEGWSVNGLTNANVTNGLFSATVSSGDPQFLSPDNLDLNLAGLTNIYLRLHNGSALTNGRVYFQTAASPSFVGNSVSFVLGASDPGFTTYAINMSAHPNWSGVLKQLRLDLPDGAGPGALMELDWVALGEAGTRPNIVFILCDDLGWNDVSINGSTFYHTPNVERLAARGMRFTQAYTANPLCSPTRASILTGQYPGRLRFTEPNGHLAQVVLDPVVPATAASTAKLREPQSCTRLKNEYITYAEVLKTNGFSTAFMGKWHLGRDEYIPDNQGFDTVVGGRYHAGPPGGYFAPFASDSNLPSVPAGTHVNDVLADSACAFIQTNRTRPFLLNLWFYDVHAPFQCKTNLRAGYLGQTSTDGRQKNPTMGAMVECMDSGLGRVLDRLEVLGLQDDTILVFFSDNGGNMYDFTDGALPTHNYPLRSGKASTYEGGTHVPCVVVWPGHTAPASTNASLLSSVDFYPTMLDMLGLEPVPGTVLDGVSQVPALLGIGSPRTNVFCHFPHSTPATATFAGCWVRSGDWKLIRYFYDNPDRSHRYELYQLASDPHELTNVAGAYPALVPQLDLLITNHLATIAALLPEINSAYVRAVYAWEPNEQVRLFTGGNNRLLVSGNGFEPTLTCNADLSSLGTPAKVILQMQARSFGDGKLFWRLPGQTGFPPAQSVTFPVIRDDTLRTNIILFNPGGPVAQLRLQPSADVNDDEIAAIQLLNASDLVLRTWLWPDPDDDGDGHSTSRELTENRDPEGAGDLAFEFDTDGDFEGWTAAANLTGAEVSYGTLNGTTTTGDPQLQNLGFNFSASAVPKLALRLRSTAAGGVQLYFASTATNVFSGAQLVTVSYTNPPNWQTLIYSLATNPAWAGKTITRLRFDPASVANADFDIDWIRSSDGRLNDRLNFALAAPSSSTNLHMRFYGGAGLTYHMESATNLPASAWSVLDIFGPLSISGEQCFDFNPGPDPAGRRFFRIRVTEGP